MNCPHCKAEEKWLIKREFLSFDKKYTMANANVMGEGSLENLCKYWFEIQQYHCTQCGDNFWIQDESQ